MLSTALTRHARHYSEVGTKEGSVAGLRKRPAYVQVADDLRAQILDDSLHDGDQLPSESDLMAEYDVSRIVVRNALEILRSEGLVQKQQGRGSFVRVSQPARRRVVGDFYSTRPQSSPFAASVRAAGREPTWEHQTRHTPASDGIAKRLQIKPGEAVVRTSYRFFADREPLKLSTSYEPHDLTANTPIEEPEGGSVTGVIPRMDSIGHHITHVAEEVTARSARPHEAELLDIPTGAPVMLIERTYYTAERPVETADIVVSADKYTLAYNIAIPPRD
jgi:DNA-binding GntR family transcriptional regulator